MEEIEETRNHTGMVLTGTAHLDGHIDSSDHERIELMLAGGQIYLEQVSTDRDGNIVENEVVISSKWQAVAVIQIVRALAAAQGWDTFNVD